MNTSHTPGDRSYWRNCSRPLFSEIMSTYTPLMVAAGCHVQLVELAKRQNDLHFQMLESPPDKRPAIHQEMLRVAHKARVLRAVAACVLPQEKRVVE